MADTDIFLYATIGFLYLINMGRIYTSKYHLYRDHIESYGQNSDFSEFDGGHFENPRWLTLIEYF